MTQFLIEALRRHVVGNPARSQADRNKAVEAIRDLEVKGAPVCDDKEFSERFMREEMDLAIVVGDGIFCDLHPAGWMMDLVADDEADAAFQTLAAKEIAPLLLKHGIDVEHTKHCKVCRAAYEPKWPT